MASTSPSKKRSRRGRARAATIDRSMTKKTLIGAGWVGDRCVLDRRVVRRSGPRRSRRRSRRPRVSARCTGRSRGRWSARRPTAATRRPSLRRRPRSRGRRRRRAGSRSRRRRCRACRRWRSGAGGWSASCRRRRRRAPRDRGPVATAAEIGPEPSPRSRRVNPNEPFTMSTSAGRLSRASMKSTSSTMQMRSRSASGCHVVDDLRHAGAVLAPSPRTARQVDGGVGGKLGAQAAGVAVEPAVDDRDPGARAAERRRSAMRRCWWR